MKAVMSYRTMFIVATILACLFLLAFFVTTYARTLYPVCWSSVLKSLDDITGEKAGGFRKLLGQSEFQVKIKVMGECVDKIAFKDYQECITICGNFPGDKEKCRENCGRCKETNGCITAVPRIPSSWHYGNVVAWFQGDPPFETYQKRRLNVKTYNSKYAFDFELKAPRDTKFYCLHFTKTNGAYSIDKYEVKEEEKCG